MARAAAEDPALALRSLVRIAKREPKFDWRAKGDPGNPLFKGFDGEDPDAERYDEPVLVRLGVEEGELVGGFPKDAETLFGYHAIVLDDVERAFFTHDQLDLVKDFVARRGGGLLLLGGPESLSEGDYLHSPLADLSPVYLDKGAPPGEVRAWRWRLTREGRHETWTRLRDNEADEDARLDHMPSFRLLHRHPLIKPGAVVLSEVVDGVGGAFPAVVEQRFGAGVTVAVLLGDLWRWRMRHDDAASGVDDPGQAWRQTLRRLAVDAPAQVEVVAVPGDSSSEQTLQVRVRDAEYFPSPSAVVTAEIESPEGESYRVDFEPDDEQSGLYAASRFNQPRRGCTALQYRRATKQVNCLATRKPPWPPEPDFAEMRRVTPNMLLLERIAEKTGGRVIKPNELSTLAEELLYEDAEHMEYTIRPLWHAPAVFLAAVLLVVF